MAYQQNIPMNAPHVDPVQPVVTPGGGAGPSTGMEIDLVDIVARIWRRRFTVIASIVFGMLVAGGAALVLQPNYTSQSRIMIETRQTEIVQSEAVLSDLTATEQVVETEIEVIRSGEINERVADRLGLQEIMAERAEEARQNSLAQRISTLLPSETLGDWVLTVSSDERVAALIPEAWAHSLVPPNKPEQPPSIQDAITLLAKKLDARQIGNTAVIEISATDRDPELAQKLVAVTAREYLDAQVEWKSAATLMANSWLRGRIDELQLELTEKQRDLEYMRSAIGVVGDDGRSLLAEQQMLANARLHDARAQRIRLQTKLGKYEEALTRGGLDELAAMFDRSLLAQLRINEGNLNQQIAELSSIYGPQHPQLVDAENKLSSIRTGIEDEARRALNEVRSEFAASQLEETELTKELDGLAETAQDLGHQRTKLSVLQSEIDTMQSLMESYLTRYKETREQEAITRPDARVITTASLPESPDFPSPKLLLLAGFVVSSAVGVVLAFLRDMIDRTVRSVADVERTLNVPVIQALPAISRRALGNTSPAEYVVLNPASPYAESLRAMVTTLKAIARPGAAQRILVTSAVKGEGKSSTAAALSRLLQRAGYSVALIECDLRRPTLARVLKCQGHLGLRQILEGSADVGAALQRDPVSGMSFISSGGTSNNSLFLLQSAKMKELVNHLSSSNDIIVLDSPPVMPLPDANALCELADATVLLCRWGSTSRDLSAAAVRMLTLWGSKAVTVVLSQVDSRRYLSYESSYVSGGAGYGYAETKDS
ncbi:MAG: Wzz/FepE/Etk N-terminal domain-containing protein [Pseudomonadota bacterium]